MNVFLAHIDWSPIIYGVALFLSVMSMGWKLKQGQYIGFAAEVLVVGLILVIHGGSVTGGCAATIAGLLSGWFIPLLFAPSASSKLEAPSASSKPEASPAPPPVLSAYEVYQLSRLHRN